MITSHKYNRFCNKIIRKIINQQEFMKSLKMGLKAGKLEKFPTHLVLYDFENYYSYSIFRNSGRKLMCYLRKI